jgi:hypothetical protein
LHEVRISLPPEASGAVRQQHNNVRWDNHNSSGFLVEVADIA